MRFFLTPTGVVSDTTRVLVIDDDPKVRQTLVDILSVEPTYQVDTGSDGYDALIKLGSFRPHVLVLDVRLSGLDAFHACRRVKADPVAGATRILALTGYADDGARARMFAAGADACLEKPVQLAVLRDEIARLASAPTPHVTADPALFAAP